MFESNSFFDRSDSEWMKEPNRTQWPANAFCPIDMKKKMLRKDSKSMHLNAEFEYDMMSRENLTSAMR